MSNAHGDSQLREDCRKILDDLEGDLLETAHRFLSSLHEIQTRWDYVRLASAEVRSRQNQLQTREALVERLLDDTEPFEHQGLRPKILKDVDRKKDSPSSRAT